MAMCGVCLRTNVAVNKVDKSLVTYYNELVKHKVMQSKFIVCATCKKLLKIGNIFKELCQKSNMILQHWKKKKKKTEISTGNLHGLIQSYFNKVVETNDETQIKTETILEHNINKDNLIPNTDNGLLKYNDNGIPNHDNGLEYNDNIIPNNDNGLQYNDNRIENNDNIIDKNDDILETNDSLIHNDNENNFAIEPKEETDLNLINNEYNGIGDNNYNGFENNTSDSDDDKVISQLVHDIKVKKRSKVKKKKEKLLDKLDKKVVLVGAVKKRHREKQPLKNKQEYESIFDIIYFKTDEDAKAEFAERPNSDYYKDATFKCTVCYMVFRCQKLLDFHMKWHDLTSGDHICDICEMRFKSYLSMRKHKNNAHYGRYCCKMCPLITYHKMVMIMHSRKHQGVEYKCKYCNKIYNHSSTYLTHVRTSHRTQHACTLCARTFVSPAGLRVHRLRVHQTTSDVETDNSVKCNDCNLTFTNQDVYVVHVMNTPCHKDVAALMIACPECGKRFDDKLSLRSHRRQVHPNYNYTWMKNASKPGAGEKKEFTCRECGATGGHNSWLYNHYKMKHPELTYEVAVYSDKRKHLCDQCGRSFRHPCQLSEHARVHTGVRPHACVVCGARFRTTAHLRLHAERHNPPARTCTTCDKKFVSASNLANHMRSHIGERRYKCSVCSKAFLHSAALREHVRGVHLHVRRDRRPKRQVEQTHIHL